MYALRALSIFFALAAVAVFCGCASGAGAANADTLSRIQKSGEIVWAGDIQGGEPYVYEDLAHPGKIIGFEVDIAEALARRLGVRARFFPNDWSNLVPSLERGDFDVIMNGLEATPERHGRILLSRPYFAFVETLAVRRGAPFRTLSDLSGKRVGTLNQTYAFDVLQGHGDLQTAIYEGQEEPYADLEEGRTDGVLLDSIIADRYGCANPALECFPQASLKGFYVIGIRKGDERLKAAIDDALAGMLADGELQKILESWKLWDDHQAELASPEIVAANAAETDHAPPRALDRGQVVLFLQGAVNTLALSSGAFALAMPMGILLALGRLYGGRPGRALSTAYIEIFRGTPVLLQLYVLYYGLAPIVKLGPVVAAILGLGMNYAAYEAEIYRGALLALPRGQSEAAAALGLSRAQMLRHVLLPQALKNALPSMTNDFVALLKDSSLVSVITVVELTKRMTISAVELRSWLPPGLLCAALYFAMSFPLARLARTLEKRLARDQHPEPA
jgi:polar amino acid transport system substrate-binding protein